MAMKIEETFEVQAPITSVWEYLIDPQRVVGCLPGAELTEVQDERTFQGRIRVKVGPVTASYKGTARLEKVDEAEHRVRMTGEGKETAGAGSARMTMTSRLVELPGGGTQVEVQAEVDVVGRIVQFGRGLMEEVSRQLFRQFASCVQATLAQPAATETAEMVEEDAGGDGTPAAASEPPPEAATAAASGIPPTETQHRAADSVTTPPQSQSRSASGEPVRALPLLLRAVSAMARRLFGRLFRR